MLPHTRRTRTHIELETDAWRDAVLLESELAMLYRPIVAGAKVGRGMWEDAVAGLVKEGGAGFEGEKEAAGAVAGPSEDGQQERRGEGSIGDKKSELGGGEAGVTGGVLGSGVSEGAPDDSKGLPGEQSKELVMASLAEMTREMAGSGLASPNFFAVMVGMLVEAGTPSEQSAAPSDVREEDSAEGSELWVPTPLARLTATCAGVLATWVEIDQAREMRRTAAEGGGQPTELGGAERAVVQGGVPVGATQMERIRLMAQLRAERRVRPPRGSSERGKSRLPGLPALAGLAAPNQGVAPPSQEEPVEGGGSRPFQALAEQDTWPVMRFDVTAQPVSFHLPLHRMLAHCFRGAVESAEGGEGAVGRGAELLRSLLPEKYRGEGFPAAVMEHVLQLQVGGCRSWRRTRADVLACEVWTLFLSLGF
jgi:hypothetical protein